MAATTELSKSVLYNLCQRYHDHNYQSNQPRTLKVLSYEHSSDTNTVTGFLGRHQLLKLKVQRIDGDGQGHCEQIRFFTKSPPLDLSSRMEYIEECGVFRKEVQVYSEVLPELEKIFTSIAPKCYYADELLLVFEHLADQGFRMTGERDGILNYEHLYCALKSLAALHASSIVYEVRCGRKINELHPCAVTENSYPNNVSQQHLRVQNFNNALRAFAEFIKMLPKYKDNLNYILLEFPKRMAVIYDLTKTSTKYMNVFSHGDLWANNIMYQYENFGESPIQCRLLDFQMTRYAPPMLDLMSILTIPTSRSFREQYMLELLCDYYSFMTDFLKQEQFDVKDFLPRSQFDDMAKHFRIVGLIESLLFSHLTILPTTLTEALTSTANGFKEFFDSKRVEICLKAFKTDDIYRDRMTDMLEDFIDNFVLKDLN